jgi:hypothetical protein
LDEATQLIERPGQILDKVVEALAKVGIELPALVLQLFLLVLTLVVLFVALRMARAETGAKPLELVGAVALGLIAAGIVFGIAAQALLPNRLIGRVAAKDRRGVAVELLDFRGQGVSMSGAVDSTSGEFIAYYSPVWYGRARTLRITAAACKARDHAMSRGRLRTESTWEFTCEKP